MIRAALAAVLVALVASGAASPTPHTRCPAGTGFAHLAYVKAGALLVLDMPACGGRVLVAHGASGPVRWSADGQYVAFGGGVVSVADRRLYRGLRGVWSPLGHVLATPTRGAGLVVAEPGGRARRLLPDGFGVGAVAFDPRGRLVAADRAARRELWVVDLASRVPRLVHRAARGDARVPELAGWAGRGALLFRLRVANASSANLDGLPLYVVSLQGGPAHLVTASILSYEEFAARCGTRLVLAAGGDRFTTRSKRIVVAAPPAWRGRDVSRDRKRSWVSATCAPAGRDLAASAGRSWVEPSFGLERRAIWRLALDGQLRRRITNPPPGRSDELPRWTRERGILFVRTGPTRADGSARGLLYLIDARGALRGPLADLGTTGNYYGRYGWAEQTDLFVP